MPLVLYDQSNFSAGVLDPKTYARTDTEIYAKAAKDLTNCINIPQGGVMKRWGTTYVDTLATATDWNFAEISTFVFESDTTYLLVWEAMTLSIYFNNVKVATVATPYNQEDIANLRFAQVETRVIVANLNFNPYQLQRSADAPNAITAFSGANNTLTVTNPLTVGVVLPAQFTTTGSLPTTNPQIYAGRTYFINPITANTFQIFSTPSDAVNLTNPYTITNAGVNSNLVTLNTWSFTAITFVNVPGFDFATHSYSAINFTPSAVSGNITITASAPVFTAAMIGGQFIGNGGIARIVAPFISSTQVNATTITSFNNTNAIPGTLANVLEPAWSNTRGWPKTVSFFQQRLVFAGSPSIPNGVWLSVVNDAFNFDDSEALADNAISWYPGTETLCEVQSITSGRSLLIHTNTCTFSTTIQTEQPLTPTNFVLNPHSKLGVSSLQPVFIDNQIIFVDRSGNNVINMVWEIYQNSYVTNNISVASSFLIDQPTDMAAFSEPKFTDGFFVLFVNQDGTLAIFQTLREQNVAAWSNAITKMTDNLNPTDSFFRRVTSDLKTVWFLVERNLTTTGLPQMILGFNNFNNTLYAFNHGFSTATPTIALISQLTTLSSQGHLPTTFPPLQENINVWIKATDANNFSIYPSQLDAQNGTNPYFIVDAGTNAFVFSVTLTKSLYIEQLDFNVFTDSSKEYVNVNSNTLTGLAHLNNETVQIIGDGFNVAPQIVTAGSITLPVTVRNATVGLQYIANVTPLPIGRIEGIPTNLYKPKHIRGFYINFFNTLGATIQGADIPTQQFQQVNFNQPATPESGIFEYTLQEGWDGNEFSINIQQPNPFPMTIIGISYLVEVV